METQKVFNLWNSSVRDIYNLPRAARTYLIENVLSTHHGFKTDIMSRFQKFVKSLFNCPMAPVRMLASMLRTDVWSVFGKNIACITKEVGRNPLEISRMELIRKLSSRQEPPCGDEFMIDVFRELYDGLQSEDTEGRGEINNMIYVISMSYLFSPYIIPHYPFSLFFYPCIVFNDE